jgi:hypothetical protein
MVDGDRGGSVLQRLGLPAPTGWPVERVVSLLAGGMVVGSLAAGRARNPRWRILTGMVGANLMLQGIVGWCPTSGLLYKLGVPLARECRS